MRVFHYDRDGYALSHESEARPMLVAEGEEPQWSIPARATFIEPPAAKAGFLIKWVGDPESEDPMSMGSWMYAEIPPTPESEPLTLDDKRAIINGVREERIADGFVFDGVKYQSREADLANITGASVAAMMAIIGGAKAGNLRWNGGDSDFTWIADDNSQHAMDAQTVIRFGQAAMEHKRKLIYVAREMKNLDVIPDDFQDDKYWLKA